MHVLSVECHKYDVTIATHAIQVPPRLTEFYVCAPY